MAISGQYAFHAGTSAAFAEAKAASKIVAQDLYFLTDTKELFVGETKYCNPLQFVTEDPAASAAVDGMLYVNTVSHKVTTLNGEAMVEVAPQIVAAIAADTADGAVANVKAIKDYVAGQVGELGNPVKDAAYDSTTQKITLTYNDNTTKDLALKDLITGVSYNAKTGDFTFTRANNAEALVINTPVEDFLKAAAIDEATHILTLTLEGGATVTVDLSTLVDVYTVDDTATVNMTMDNGKITADVNVSAAEGNAVIAKTDGIYVAIPKDYIQSIEDTKSIDLTVDANGKLTADAKVSATTGNKVQIADDGLFVAADYIGSIEDTSSIDLDVTSAKLKADVKLSANDNNAITKQTDGLHVDISGKVDKNADITAATKCKITYDAKGLVTAGADLAEADIPSLHLAKVTDVTATAAEVNVLDGITASTAELNYVKGVTSAIQDQIDGKQASLTTDQLAAVNSGITADKVSAYDTHVANADIHVTAAQKTAWTAKQDALSEAQLAAANSGITAAKVATYDGYATTIAGKADKATTLAGYGITDAYTKEEVNTLLTWKTI